jgi:molybdopterin-binding protein
VATFRIREASSLLGVSTDTLRRWADDGRIDTITDSSGRLAVDGVALAKLAQELAEPPGPAADQGVVAQSARNRFRGLITRVVRDTVMAQVEIQAGPYRFVSLLSREAADELGLEPGMLAVAAVKATNVSVEIPGTGPTRSSKPPHQLAVLSTPNAAAGPTAPGTSRSRRPGFNPGK